MTQVTSRSQNKRAVLVNAGELNSDWPCADFLITDPEDSPDAICGRSSESAMRTEIVQPARLPLALALSHLLVGQLV